MNITIEYIFIAEDHNYVGHHGKPSGNHPAEYRQKVKLLAGRGIEDDRFSLKKPGHPKQITFFDMDVIDQLAERFQYTVPPESVRRNVFVRGLNLPELVGKTFSINGIRFEGVDPCKPCYWMDEAIAEGAEAFLKGKGGLRARILDDGDLAVGETEFTLLEECS